MKTKQILESILRTKELMGINEDMKYIRQPDGISCGPTCIKMVGDFIKGEVSSISDICKSCGTDNLVGTPPERMIKGLDSLGIEYKIHSNENNPIQTLKNILDSNHVAILRTLTRGYPHWIVVVSYNGDTFDVNDPWLGQIKYTREELIDIWKNRDFYYFEIITGFKKQPKGNVTITSMTSDDQTEIFSRIGEVYRKINWKDEEIVDAILSLKPNKNSFVAKVDGELAGFYLIGPRQIPMIPGNDDYEILKDMRGAEGIALGVFPEYKNMGIGKKLIEHSRNNLDVDYIWGGQLKSLENIDDWLKRRKIYYENDNLYLTYEILKK